MSVHVPCPDEQHSVHHGLYTAILTGIILPLRPFLNSQAAHYRLSIFSEKLRTTTFLPEQGCVYEGALDNRAVKSPELAALIARVAAVIEAVPVLGEFLGKANKLLQQFQRDPM